MSTELIENGNSEIAITDKEMVELLERVYEAEVSCQEAESVVEDQSSRLKAAKNVLDARITRLRDLSSQLHELLRGTKMDEERPLLNVPSETTNAEQSTEWRSLSTELLLEPPIEGFGAKKRQALLDALPTLGDFEDLRGKVGIDAATLRELLPKGIGEQAADALEERLITAIRDGIIVEPPAAIAEAVVDAPPSIEDLQAQAVQLVDHWRSKVEGFHEYGETLTQDFVMRGAEAYNDGDEVENCPHVLGTDEQYAWLYGWVSEYVADPKQTQEISDTPEADEVSEVDENEFPDEEPATVAPETLPSRSLTTQQLLDEL